MRAAEGLAPAGPHPSGVRVRRVSPNGGEVGADDIGAELTGLDFLVRSATHQMRARLAEPVELPRCRGRILRRQPPAPGAELAGTRHQASQRNTLSPGLSLPATFGPSGAVIGGSATQQGTEPTYSFTVQGTGDHGQPLWQAYQITVDQNLPLTIVLPASGSTLEPGRGGQAYAQNFFLSGGAPCST